MQIDGHQKPNMDFEKGWSEESWLFLVVLLQKLKEFSVLSLYRNLMALNRRALITGRMSWKASSLSKQLNCCRVSELCLCLPFQWVRYLWHGAPEQELKNLQPLSPIHQSPLLRKTRVVKCISQTLNLKGFQEEQCLLCGEGWNRWIELSCWTGWPWLRHGGRIYSNRSSSGLERPLSKAGCRAMGSLLAMMPDWLFLSVTLGFVSRGEFCYL